MRVVGGLISNQKLSEVHSVPIDMDRFDELRPKEHKKLWKNVKAKGRVKYFRLVFNVMSL